MEIFQILETALLFCCLLVAWLFYTHYYRPYHFIKKTLRLPGPPPSFFYGNYSEIARLGYLDCISKWTSQYGSTFVYYLGIMPIVVTTDLEIIKSIMVKNFDSFINRSFMPFLIKKENKIEELTFLRDEEWQRVRRILVSMFTSKKLKMMGPIIEECCGRLKNKMATISRNDNSVDIWKWFGPYTLEVVLATGFSRDISMEGGQESPLSKATSILLMLPNSTDNYSFKKLQTILSHFPWSEPVLKYFTRQTATAQGFDYVQETALKLIEDRRKTMATTRNMTQDLLQYMLEAHDENKRNKSKGHLSNGEIVGSMITFITASYETIRAALSYTAYLIALNPTIQDKLTKEIKDYYDSNPDSSLYDAAENIEYVTMVLYESLRMCPPSPDAHRECNKTCTINDKLTILQDCAVCFPFFSLHLNSDYWPNPNVFDPERFDSNKGHCYPTFAYLPFGEGPRQCIGKRLALLVIKMTLVAVLKDFQFRETANTEVPLELTCDFVINPKNGIYLSIVSNPL